VVVDEREQVGLAAAQADRVQRVSGPDLVRAAGLLWGRPRYADLPFLMLIVLVIPAFGSA
jgi:hypothetical protein